MNDQDFEIEFGTAKPTEVIIYCHSGARSKAACEIARQSGIQRLRF